MCLCRLHVRHVVGLAGRKADLIERLIEAEVPAAPKLSDDEKKIMACVVFALRLWPTPWSPTRVTCFMYDCTCCAVLCCVFASIESDLASKTVAQLKEMLACVGKRCRELRGWAAPRIRT